MADCKSIMGNPCSFCIGNKDLCSNEDPTLQYNSLTCDLLIEWITRKPEGRPKGSKTKPHKETYCENCGSAAITRRGIRKNKHENMQVYFCYDCKHGFSMKKEDG